MVPDNTRTGITKACFYEPDINPSYLDMAQHYAYAILPTRVRKPRDKAMGEGAVLLVERWILARIRNETFFSLSELNRRLRELIEDLNGRPFQKLPGTRRSAFEEIDRSALKPLHLILTAPAKDFISKKPQITGPHGYRSCWLSAVPSMKNSAKNSCIYRKKSSFRSRPFRKKFRP